jgi:transcriptional regulator with XRE-family HTH domain
MKRLNRARIRQTRKGLKLTLQGVSLRTGIDAATLSRWERGLTDIRVEQLERVASVLEIDLREYFDETVN